MNQGCTKCAEFSHSRPIPTHDELDSLHGRLMTAIRNGRLEIELGDLPWSDVMDCTLKCPNCRRRFHLTCETYHGCGGEWRAEKTT